MLWHALLRRVVAVVVALNVAVGGPALAAPDFRSEPAPVGTEQTKSDVSTPHDADDGHEHRAKKDCHCAPLNCNGWNLAPAAPDLADLDAVGARHGSRIDLAYLPYLPSLPLEPPRS
jgi:hypothetical protein